MATAAASFPDLSHLPAMRIGAGEDHSFIAAFRRLLAALRQAKPYWYLMAVSGAAFRLQIHCNGWRMNSTDAMTGFDLTGGLFEAFGLRCERLWVCGEPQRLARARTRIIENLARGWPTIGLGMDGRGFHGVIVGAITDENMLALDYSARGRTHEVLQRLVWCYHLLTAITASHSEEDHIRQAFALALRLATTSRAASFHLGADAYSYWHATLTNPDHHNPLGNDWRVRERNDGNYWLYISLLDARRAAEQFCRWVARRLPAAAPFAIPLADHYAVIAATLEPLLTAQTVRPAAHINAARPWTMHERRKQALVLQHVADVEQRAAVLVRELHALLQDSGAA
jgi:hypothetical protein